VLYDEGAEHVTLGTRRRGAWGNSPIVVSLHDVKNTNETGIPNLIINLTRGESGQVNGSKVEKTGIG